MDDVASARVTVMSYKEKVRSGLDDERTEDVTYYVVTVNGSIEADVIFENIGDTIARLMGLSK